MKKIIGLNFIFIIFFLFGCATKHYQKGSDLKMKPIPAHLQGNLVLVPVNGAKTTMLSQSPKTIKSKQSITTEPLVIYTPQPQFGLPGNVRTWLDDRLKDHQKGKKIIGIYAIYPQNNIPVGHRAYKIQKYLKKGGVNVKIAPKLDPLGSKKRVQLIY